MPESGTVSTSSNARYELFHGLPRARMAHSKSGFNVFLIVFAMGCGASHVATALPNGIMVHTFTRGLTNAHLVAQGDAYFLVDAGLASNALGLDGDLRENGFDPARLRAIVLTHGHYDHAGGARHFQVAYGTPVIAGRGDEPLLIAGRMDTLCPVGWQAQLRHTTDQSGRFPPVFADRVIDSPTELVALTGVAGTIVPLAGHTSGSIMVDLGDAVLVGDLFRGGLVSASAERHFYMCDIEDNRADIRELLEEISPRASTFFTGHFGPVDRSSVLALVAQ